MSDHQRNTFTAHVTAFGALWGFLEITVGSFLHTLRFPFAGILLASASAALLVGQRQLLPRRGVSLATGVVASLCKSLSPGGIILGPMIGILTEALLVEVALLPSSRAAACVALAGVLCALWAASQKLVTQYVLYGAKVIDLYLAALGKAGRWLGVSPAAGWWSLAALLVVVALMGGAGGLLGRKIGQDSVRRLDAEDGHA